MKKLAIGVAVVVVLLVAAVVAIPFLVPTDAVVDRVVAQVEAQTGRQLTIDGPVNLTIFPSIGVRLGDVALSNAEGAAEPDMVRLGELDVEVAILPLLRGEVAVDRFVLREPVIALEIDEQGQGNWQFTPADDQAAAPAEPAPDAPAPEEGAGGGLGGFTIGDARIVDGTLSFVDRRDGTRYELTELDLALELGDLSGPASVDGSGVFNGEAVTIEASADDLGAVTGQDAGTAPLQVAIEAAPVSLAFEGTAGGGGGAGARGDLRLTVPSLQRLSAWLPGAGLPAGLPVDRVELTAAVDAAPQRIAFGGMALRLDDAAITGDLAVAVDGDRPSIVGALAVTELDLDELTAQPAAAAPGPAPGQPADGGGAAAATAQPTPVDLSPLRAADVQLTVDLAGLRARGVDVGASRLALEIQDGALDLSMAETAIFGGRAAAELSAAAGDPQTMTLTARLDGIDLARVPLPVAGVADVAGRIGGEVAGSTRGGTIDALIANLQADGQLTIADAAATYDPGSGARPIVVSGLGARIEATENRIAVRDLALTADDVAAAGNLAVALGGARPAVEGELRLGRLDLDRWIGDGGTTEAAPAPPPAGGAGTGAPPAGWSTEPIDLSALRIVDADLDLATEGVAIRGIETGPSNLAVALDDGDLDATLSPTPVAGGTIGATVAVESGNAPRLAGTIDLTDVQAEPLLAAAADFDRLLGTVNGRIDVAATGSSQRDLVETLNGDGALLFSDGAVRGVNIAAMLRNVGSAFDPDAGAAQQTDFAELGGTFRIESGLLTSNDIRMLAPLFRVEGAGQSSIPQRTLQFRLEPRLVASIEGQGGTADLGGIAVPIIISGTYDDVSFRPDLAGAVRNVLQDPAAVRQQIDALGGQADDLKDRLGDDPERAIRGLLQNLTGGGSGAAAPAGEPTPAQEGQPPQQPADDPARRLLEGILGGQQGGQPAEGGETKPADPVEQLRGLFR